MKKIIISAAAAAALVTGLVLCLHSICNLDPILEANIEALTQTEGTPVKTCYIDGFTGEYGYALFCNRDTSTSMLYPCQSESYGNKSSSSYCTTK